MQMHYQIQSHAPTLAVSNCNMNIEKCYTITYRTLTPNGAHLHKLIKLDCPIFIDVDLPDHVPDLVARHTLPEGLQNGTNLRNCNVTVAISIKLWVHGGGGGGYVHEVNEDESTQVRARC